MIKKIRIWSPNCPPDYVSVGYVTTISPDHPKRGDIYCVRRYFVELDNFLENENKYRTDTWELVWDSDSYNSNEETKLYRQIGPSNPELISPVGFAAALPDTGSWTEPPTAFYFKKLHVDFYPNTPVLKQWLVDKEYHKNSKQEEFTHGAKVGRAVIFNWSHVQQSALRSISYSKTTSVENLGGNGFELGLSLEGKTKKKGVEKKGSLEVDFSRAVSRGTATDSSETDAMEIEVEIPAFSKVAVSIKSTVKKTRLRYTATQVTLYVNGTETRRSTEGFLQEIKTVSSVVDYGRFQPLKTDDTDNSPEPTVVSQKDPLANSLSATEGAEILYRKKFKETNLDFWRAVDYNRNGHEVSFFRPLVNTQAKECALGDVAAKGNKFPNYGHLIVAAQKASALRTGCQFSLFK